MIYWVDIVIAVFMAVAAFMGLSMGLIGSLFPFMGLIGGILFAGHFYKSMADLIMPPVSQDWANVLAYVFIVAAAVAASWALTWLLRRAVGGVVLSWIDRLAGALFGLLAAAVISGFLLIALFQFPMLNMEVTIPNPSLSHFLMDRLPPVLGLPPDESDSVLRSVQ